MQAELTIKGKTGTPPPAPANAVKIGRGKVAGRTATVPVTCALDATCAGLLQLLRRATAAKAAKSRKPTVYGRARFSIPARKTVRVKVKLTKAGKKLLRRKRGKSVRMVARATVGSQVTTTTVKLSRKSRKSRK
jgi:hypothetical protein